MFLSLLLNNSWNRQPKSERCTFKPFGYDISNCIIHWSSLYRLLESEPFTFFQNWNLKVFFKVTIIATVLTIHNGLLSILCLICVYWSNCWDDLLFVQYILVCVLYIQLHRQHFFLLVFLLRLHNTLWYLVGNSSKWVHTSVNHCFWFTLFFWCANFFWCISIFDKVGRKTFWTSVSYNKWFFKNSLKFWKFLSNNRIWGKDYFGNILNLLMPGQH